MSIRCAALIIWLLLSMLESWPGVASAEGPRIAVLTSHQAPPYQAVLESLEDELGKQVKARVDVYALDGDGAKVANALPDASQNGAQVIVAFGGLATRAVLETSRDQPIIAGLILRADQLDGAAHATGVTLEFPVHVQLEWLRRVLPAAKTIGVLYNPAENQDRIVQAIQVANRLGLKLEAQAVERPNDIPVALESVGKRVGVLWGIVDALVLTPQTAKHILLFSFRHRIPFVGISPAWVKSGALYALDWDYQDLGKQ